LRFERLASAFLLVEAEVCEVWTMLAAAFGSLAGFAGAADCEQAARGTNVAIRAVETNLFNLRREIVVFKELIDIVLLS
jgi:hypothetical protein